jgi:hypothetical protein
MTVQTYDPKDVVVTVDGKPIESGEGEFLVERKSDRLIHTEEAKELLSE